MNASSEKVALVTGSGRRRIGNVVARSLAETGYSIALHYHSSAEAARVSVEEISGVGIDCEAYRANVAVGRSDQGRIVPQNRAPFRPAPRREALRRLAPEKSAS